MTAQILDGKAASAAVRAELTERVARLAERGVVPGLATVLVGDDPGSHSYVGGKHKACAAVGVTSFRHDLPADTSREKVLGLIAELNADPAVDGFIVQLPLPAHLDAGEIPEDERTAGMRPREKSGVPLGEDDVSGDASLKRAEGKRYTQLSDRNRCRFTRAGVKRIDYKDVVTLQKLMTAQAKVMSRKRSGMSRKMPRLISRPSTFTLMCSVTSSVPLEPITMSEW